MLDAQQIHDVGCRQNVIDACEMVTPSFSKSRGTSVPGPTSVTFAPSLVSPKIFERATRLKRMSPIIATCRSGDRAFLFANGVKIEQRLGRMFVRAVAGVDHAGFQPLGQKLRRAGGSMAQDNDVGMVRFKDLWRCPLAFRLSSGWKWSRKC